MFAYLYVNKANLGTLFLHQIIYKIPGSILKVNILI